MADRYLQAVKERAERNKAMLVQSIKIVAVLVAICLVCTLLLAIAKDLFYVSDEERFNRSLAKIYSGFELAETLTVQNDTCAPAYGKVLSVVRATDGGYVVEALGNGGFNDGSVTLYVAMQADGRIKGWAIKENVGQSFISKITEKHQQTWYIPADDSVDVSAVEEFDLSKATGATYTSTAINHAVNVALHYVKHHLAAGDDTQACVCDDCGAVAEVAHGLAYGGQRV